MLGAYELMELFDDYLGDIEIEGNYYHKGDLLQQLDPDHYDNVFAEWVQERCQKTGEDLWEML